jgi:radical SAM protein with 4Fe4S-binding SPASM domain
MTFEQYKVIADKIRPYAKYLYLHLWGEPMLNRDIIRMIRHASQFTRTNISTNGLTLTPELAEELITSGVSDIIVSIDGITQEVYEKYRVGGDVLSALESLRLLVELNKKHGARVNISPQFVVFKHNQDEMKLFETFCAGLGLATVFKAPYLRDDTVLERADDRRFHRPVFDSVASLRRAMTACGAVRNDFVILVDGSVVACCHDYDGKTTFGNIFKEDVAQIWNKPAYRTFRTAVTSGNAPAYCVDNCMSYFLKNTAAGDTRVAATARETTPESRRKLKFVQVHTFYPSVLEGLYSRRPELERLSFDEQVDALLKDGFSAVHMFAPSMRAQGYESQLIVGNCAPLQRAWAIEHGMMGKMQLSSLDVLREQIETFAPDVLYISDPITFDSSFVRSLAERPPLVICWRGSAIHPNTDWTEFDVFLSSLTAESSSGKGRKTRRAFPARLSRMDKQRDTHH